ncbi:MAG: CRISPR-associated endonuclease Cas2 [Methylococcales bacterium]|nr:CRISPR-associated endonuclease Cas2 [Methylococcales bacterium]
MLYLVCFDISDNKTRNRVGKYLGAFGNRVQESVFEVEFADANALSYVQDKLADWLADGDDLRFYCLCRNCRLKSYTAKQERIAKLPSLVII